VVLHRPRAEPPRAVASGREASISPASPRTPWLRSRRDGSSEMSVAEVLTRASLLSGNGETRLGPQTAIGPGPRGFHTPASEVQHLDSPLG